MHKNIAFIPAKENSVRLKNKNTRTIQGKTLVRIIAEKAIQSNAFDKVYIDTESENVFKEVKDLDVEWLIRDKKLATNRFGANDLIKNEIELSDESENYFMLNCCTPLIKPETIRDCVEKFNKSQHDSVITVVRFNGYMWTQGKPDYDIDMLPNSSHLPERFLENHILYGIERNAFLKYKRRIGNNVMFFETNTLESFDINTKDELKIAEVLYGKI